MIIIRRVIMGAVAGLLAAGGVLLIANSGPGAESVWENAANLGGIPGILATGLLIGVVYAMLFRPTGGGFSEHLMSGLALGVLVWVILAVSIHPAFSGRLPAWDAEHIATRLPQLIAYLLMGGSTAMLCGLAYAWTGERFGLLPGDMSETAPAITKRVVILGGGYAGVSAAQALEEALRNDPSVGIWLVSQTNYLLHTPMLSEVSSSAVNAQNISPPLRSFFQRVQVVQCAVDRVDRKQRTVHLAVDGASSQRELPFDHLVLATGSVPDFFGNQAIETAALTFKSLEDAILLRSQIIDCFERADVEPDVEKRRPLLTFVVAGGGFAGVELIGGINDFTRGILPYYPNISPDEVRPILVHSRDVILPELSATLGKFAQEKLESRGVQFWLGVRVTGADHGGVQVGDNRIATETFVWTAGNQPSPVIATLGLPLNRRGQLEVNTQLAVPDAPGLWAAGDCAQIPDITTGKFAPPTAQHAVREGKVIGHNVAASLQGKPLKTFEFKAIGSLAALGHQLAVAEIMGYRFSGFLAWVMWRAIYLSKLPNLEKQVRVGLDWFLDIFFPADIVQTIDMGRSGLTRRVPSESDER